MQSRLLRISSVNATALRAHAGLVDGTPDAVEYSAHEPYAVLTTRDYEAALRFCMKAGGILPDVLQVEPIDHAEACARWGVTSGRRL
jgi:hypothetical protein